MGNKASSFRPLSIHVTSKPPPPPRSSANVPPASQPHQGVAFLRGISDMNKMIKGSIAGATGVALLMGGFGTYALWSDSADLAANAVTSGNMDVASAGAATFTDQNDVAWGEDDLIVPGDTITRSESFDFTGAGNNLAGRIRFVP